MNNLNVDSRCFLLLLITFLTCTKFCYSQQNTEPRNNHPQTIHELKSRIDSFLIENKIPGAGIAIVTKDSITYLGGVGYANMETKTPVNENSIFGTGSITKSFLGLAFLKLLEEGKINLQTPVKEIIPEIFIDNPWKETDPVRIVHLLEHTSGFNDIHFNDYYLHDNPEIPLKEGLKVSSNCRKVRWRPGSIRSYSSAGYAVAGYILEKITGEKFEDYIRKVILEPLNMTASTFVLTPENQQLFAQGYEGNYKPSPFPYMYARPAGALNSSTRDMALFVQFLMNKGKVGEEQLISAALIERMETPASGWATQAGLKRGYGLGISNTFYKGFKWCGHNGATIGYAGAFAYSRELGKGCVLFTNYYDIDFISGVNKIWNSLQDYVIGESMPHSPIVLDIAAEQLRKYVGYYELRNSRQQLVAWVDRMLNGTFISMLNDTLYQKDFVAGEKHVLIPVTEQTFRSLLEPDASKIFFQTPEGHRAYFDGESYWEKSAAWIPWFYIAIFLMPWILMLSTIPYAIVWVPIDLYKWITKKENRSKYLRTRVIPLLAVIVLLYGFIAISNQSLIDFGQKTFGNIQLFVATLFFAALSFYSLFIAIRSFWKPVKIFARVYALVVSLSCVGMTVFFSYWGIIGLRLWAY
jgi:CubicO group peptidase (beta-lactamase class C family)